MRVFLYGECDRHGSGARCYAEKFREVGHEVPFFPSDGLLEEHIRRYHRSLAYNVAVRSLKARMPASHLRRHSKGFAVAGVGVLRWLRRRRAGSEDRTPYL